MKVFLIAAGLVFGWLFFHRRQSILALCTFHIANTFLAYVLAIGRFLVFGYLAYALIAVYGCITRISSFGDVLTILTLRPSQVGGPGLIGVIAGILVGFVAFRGNWSQPDTEMQRRNVLNDQTPKKSALTRITVSILRRISK